MLSSKFLVVGFLYIFYTTGLVAASPHHVLGGGIQSCQNVRTVTVTETVDRGRPSPNAQPTKNNGNPPPVVTTRPGNVNLGDGDNATKNIKVNTKTTTTNVSTITNPVKNGDTNTRGNGNVDTKTKNTDTNTKTTDTNTKTTDTKTKPTDTNIKTTDTNTKNVNTKTAAPPANTGTGNPSKDLTLDPSVVQNVDGKGQAAGEANSLVSPNDFINFCVSKTITNGKQVQAGSCNPTPMGDIPSVDNMPSAKFNSPKNFDTIAANTPFTISLQVRNLVTGEFTNAANTYYAAPQQLVNGVIKGHSHVTVQKLTSLDSPEPLNPKIFDFFKGLNAAAKGGILTADVTKGLPAGVYRIASINSAGNHQEALGPVAQRGSFNDMIYITVTEGGNDAKGLSSGVINSTVPIPSPTGSGGKDGKGGKDQKTTLADLPVPTGTDGKNGTVVAPKPDNKDGKDPKTSPTVLPTGGKDGVVPSPSPPVKGGKDVKPSPTPLPTGGKDGAVPPPAPPAKGGKDTKTSPTPLPTPTGTGGKDTPPKPVVPVNDGKKGGKGGDATSTTTTLPKATTPAAGNGKGPDYGQYWKRMHRRSRRA